LIIFLLGNTSAQNYPSEYYKVINKDSLYAFTSDLYILFFSSPGEMGNFNFLSYIPGSFTSLTNIAFNDNYFILEDNDTLYLYDISNVYSPFLLYKQTYEFSIEQVYGFGPYFVIKVNNVLKLLEVEINSLEIKADTLVAGTASPLFKYPYIIMRRDIYKYLENFGTFNIFYMNYEGDQCMQFEFLAENKVVYTAICYNPPPLPPSICGIRARYIQEPDFPFAFINNFWADCLPAYVLEYYSGSKRYFYLMDWRIPPNGGKIVVDFSGITLYQHLSWDYQLKLTDVHLFQLGDSIFYSTPAAPAVFHKLEYTLTTIGEQESLFDGYELKNIYPNPFNPATNIEFVVPQYSFVTISILNLLGEEIDVLVSENKHAGRYKINFDGRGLPSGVYYCRFSAGSFLQIRKMILLK
jgi:hypothetical protein